MKGYLKIYVMKELSKGEKTGYELMGSFEHFTGMHRPSPGTIYPLLNSLSKKGMVKASKQKNKKAYSLTQKGARMLTVIMDERKKFVEKAIGILSPIYNRQELAEVRKNLGFRENRVRHAHCRFGLISEFRDEVINFISSKRNTPENRKKFAKIMKSATKSVSELK